MSDPNPKYITFDCYGTLIYFEMSNVARSIYAPTLAPEEMEAFVKVFSAYRLDEVLGPWKPYRQVVRNAVRRTCKRQGVLYREADADQIYAAVPTWGPHPDVPEGLVRLASRYKLVILSNAANEQIHRNVEKLGAPFHAVFTAEDAQSYKPRMQGFEYMMDKLGCGPEDLFHVSSSLRYDLMTAHDLGIKNKAFISRGHEPSTPYYGYYEVATIGELATLLGV
ncbi:MAG: haloacid dehalogenase type II [Roseiarcus sp.]